MKGRTLDTLVWRNIRIYGRTHHQLSETPAYAEYPVVGINWLQAVQFSSGEPIGSMNSF